jgi:ribosomal protein S18 acetylase RimI-like enzyme
MLSAEEYAQLPHELKYPPHVTGPLVLDTTEEQNLKRGWCWYPQLPKSEEIVKIRPLGAGEEWFLREMLYEAIFTPADEKPLPESIVELPELNHYIAGFGRQGDICCVAEQGGALIGAIWSRLFSEERKGYGFVDEQTPEISMAIKPAYRGQGIGTMLLNTLIEVLYRQGYKQLSLSVDTRNQALGLYKKTGFEVVSEEGTTQVMVKIQTA